MQTIYIDFLGFYELNKEDNWIVNLLRRSYNVKISKDAPYIFVGSFDPYSFRSEINNKISIYVPGEAIFPDFNLFDYALGFDEFCYDDRYFRYLLLSITYQRGKFIKNIDNPFDRKFCNFIYGNSGAHPNRDLLFHMLSKYKKVDALGAHLKNVDIDIEPRDGNWYQGSIDIKSEYKFSLSLENSLYKGYTSEKIISSFKAKSIPIYWGNPNITKEIDSEGFINCHDYESFEHVIEKVKEIDNDKTKYLKMLNSSRSIFFEDSFHEAQNNNLLSFFENIFDQKFEEAKRKPVGFWTNRHLDVLLTKPQKKKSLSRALKFWK